MSSNSSPVLAVELPRSALRLFPAALLLVTSVTMPWLSSLSWWLALAVTFTGLALSTYVIRSQSDRRPRSLAAVSWQQNQEWQLRFADGLVIPASLQVSSWRVAGLICLRLVDINGIRHQLMLWRFELPSLLWHQWQLRLSLEGQSSAMRPLEALH